MDCFVMTDRMTYHAIITAIPVMPNNNRIGTHVRMKIYLISLPFHPHCLNFRANMGISAMPEGDKGVKSEE